MGVSDGSAAAATDGTPVGIRSGVTPGLGAPGGAEGTGDGPGRLDPSKGSRCRWNEGTLGR